MDSIHTAYVDIPELIEAASVEHVFFWYDKPLFALIRSNV
jgi:hypothetical protein